MSVPTPIARRELLRATARTAVAASTLSFCGEVQAATLAAGEPPSGEGITRAWRPPPVLRTEWDRFLEGARTREEWPDKRREIRSRFLDLIRDSHKPAVKPPLNLEFGPPHTIDGRYVRRVIHYNVEPDERVSAYLGVPLQGQPPFPAIVASHGTSIHGKDITAGFVDAPDWPGPGYAHLDHLARRGYVVIAPDHFNMGERTPPGGYTTAPFYERHPEWTAVGKIIYDLSIAVDVLESLEMVDPHRIGVLGHSLGGSSSIDLAAYDDRIAAVASNCWTTTFQYNTAYKAFARPEEKEFVYFRHLRELLANDQLPAIDGHEVMALIAPRPFLSIVCLNDNYGGSPDSCVQRALSQFAVARAYALTGKPEHFAFYLHGQTHTLGLDGRALMYAWMDKHLKPRAETEPHTVSRPVESP